MRKPNISRLADLMEEVARKMLEGAAQPEKIAAAPVLDLVKSAAILVDKMKLLRGEPSALLARHVPELPRGTTRERQMYECPQ